jgi:6-phosphofructokinase 1
MDLRANVLAVLVGGSNAPGINGLISSVAIEASKQNLSVLGIFDGFYGLKNGTAKTERLSLAKSTRIFDKGGSILRTSNAQLETKIDIDNALRVLEFHRIKYLVTVGGVNTAVSASLLTVAAAERGMMLSIVHVPKTVFNDLPLPHDTTTFGFSTARQMGADVVKAFIRDARTMLRWYILVVLGTKAGHLALGISKAAAATLTIIPEQFADRKEPLSFSELVDSIEAIVYKRMALDKDYGTVVIGEGVVNVMDPKELLTKFGSLSEAREELGQSIAKELRSRVTTPDISGSMFQARNIGNELRAAHPNADDVSLTRNLGFGAVRYLLRGGSGDIICMKQGSIFPMPLADAIDSKTGQTKVRYVDLTKINYQVAVNYMITLSVKDFEDRETLQKLAKVSQMTEEEFKNRFYKQAVDKENSTLQQQGPVFRQKVTRSRTADFIAAQFAEPTFQKDDVITGLFSSSNSLADFADVENTPLN